MIKLVGSTTVNGKQFSFEDSIGKRHTLSSFGLDDTFYGGRVKEFFETKEGFLLCIDKKVDRNGNKIVINIAYDEETLTEEGENILSSTESFNVKEIQPLEEIQEEIKREKQVSEATSLENLKRTELIAFAKELGVEGKLATYKTNQLNQLIEEKLKK